MSELKPRSALPISQHQPSPNLATSPASLHALPANFSGTCLYGLSPPPSILILLVWHPPPPRPNLEVYRRVNPASGDAHTILTSLKTSQNHNSTELEVLTSSLPELREMTPGWPLLWRTMLSNWRSMSREKIDDIGGAMGNSSSESLLFITRGSPRHNVYNACSRV